MELPDGLGRVGVAGARHGKRRKERYTLGCGRGCPANLQGETRIGVERSQEVACFLRVVSHQLARS